MGLIEQARKDLIDEIYTIEDRPGFWVVLDEDFGISSGEDLAKAPFSQLIKISNFVNTIS